MYIIKILGCVVMLVAISFPPAHVAGGGPETTGTPDRVVAATVPKGPPAVVGSDRVSLSC